MVPKMDIQRGERKGRVRHTTHTHVHAHT